MASHVTVTRIWTTHNAEAYVRSIYDPPLPAQIPVFKEDERLHEAQRFLHLPRQTQAIAVRFGVTAPGLVPPDK